MTQDALRKPYLRRSRQSLVHPAAPAQRSPRTRPTPQLLPHRPPRKGPFIAPSIDSAAWPWSELQQSGVGDRSAGVQSSTLLLLAAQGRIAHFDAAIFADTFWEPAAVYRHLSRLTPIADAAGIPIVRVSTGHIRDDALDPGHRFASMPLFTLGPNGERGMARRQCTSEYKIRPIKAEVRRRLGYPHPTPVPAAVYAQMAIGISVDELLRARDSDVRYMRYVFPLLDLGWRREDCLRYLSGQGLGDTPKSSCVGCPFHDDGFWADLKTTSPAEWADAVAFDAAIRHGSARANADGHPLRGSFYLHPSRVPLDQAVLRPRPRRSDTPGCGPWTCPHTPPADDPAATPTPAAPVAHPALVAAPGSVAALREVA